MCLINLWIYTLYKLHIYALHLVAHCFTTFMCIMILFGCYALLTETFPSTSCSFQISESIVILHVVLLGFGRLIWYCLPFPFFFVSMHGRAGNLVDQSMTADLAGEVTSAAGPVRLEDLQRILSAIQPSGII
jgi:hypothetical protein